MDNSIRVLLKKEFVYKSNLKKDCYLVGEKQENNGDKLAHFMCGFVYMKSKRFIGQEIVLLMQLELFNTTWVN